MKHILLALAIALLPIVTFRQIAPHARMSQNARNGEALQTQYRNYPKATPWVTGGNTNESCNGKKSYHLTYKQFDKHSPKGQKLEEPSLLSRK